MATSLQGPSFSDYFYSYYFENQNTYLPVVDLSEETLQKEGDLAERPDVQKRICSLEIREILSSPIPLDDEACQENAETLELDGFTIPSPSCSTRSHCYCTIKDPQTNSTLLHARPIRFSTLISGRGDHNPLSPEYRLLTLEMYRHIQRVAAKENILVQTAQDKLLSLDREQEKDSAKHYCILMGDLPGLNRAETIQCIKEMPKEEQIECARKLCLIIQKAGIVESNFWTITLKKEDHTFCFCPSPHGLLVSKQSGLARGASVEKCARIGLTVLYNDVRENFGETTAEGGDFRAIVKDAYNDAMTSKWSKWKITLSVLSLGLIPLICAIISRVRVRFIQTHLKQVEQLRDSLVQEASSYTAQERADIKRKIRDLCLSSLSMTEGVPFAFELENWQSLRLFVN